MIRAGKITVRLDLSIGAMADIARAADDAHETVEQFIAAAIQARMMAPRTAGDVSLAGFPTAIIINGK